MYRTTSLLPITMVAALGGLLFGYDTGVINGSQYYLSQYFQLTPASKGWVVGSALLGCLVGSALAGKLSAAVGRKHSLIISALLFIVSAWGSGLPGVLPESVTVLVMFRVIGGLGIGIASINAPMYIAEVAPASKRGRLVSFYQLAIVVGFFVVFVATYLIGNTRSEAENVAFGWRLMFWSELVPCALFLLGLLFIPPSPRWLALKGRNTEAYAVLVALHGEVVANRELEEINQSIAAENPESRKREKAASLLSSGLLPIVLVGTALSALQQFTGINAVLYFGADIFERALGFGKEDVLAQQILLASVNLLFTFVAMALIDRLGRKPLLYIGSGGMFLGFLLLNYTLMTQQVGLLSLVGILTFIGSFAMSMGPVVWVLLSEMFPNAVRSVAMSVAVAVQWASNYLVAQAFPIAMESQVNSQAPWFGSLPYWFFMGCILLIVLLVASMIPETRGKTLEELESVW
ncbi:sugar porter family MFS transporter [Parahaliea maris]|uniref:D-xylose-proton symporter n=1 Tax=Parahaliea maris TaxID=2716870 RepID=A0A5C9A8G8_9GAMM|nr:sugar porter family MFS transporter [Parahaliea maris]TXS95857.1 sugar porter family MFS transporter [Parahaliea maris]